MVALADRTPSRPLRHTLLALLQATLLPAAAASAPAAAAPGTAGSSPAAQARTGGDGVRAEAAAAAIANSAAFLAAGGVEFAVDLLASAPRCAPHVAATTSTERPCPHALSAAHAHGCKPRKH